MFNISDILDLEMLESIPRSSLCHSLRPEIRKAMQKVFDLDFQGQTLMIRNLFKTTLFYESFSSHLSL